VEVVSGTIAVSFILGFIYLAVRLIRWGLDPRHHLFKK
jgi:hypothetical protein